jgi:hypothetical protein
MATLAKGCVSRILALATVLALAWAGGIQIWALVIAQAQNQFAGNVANAERDIYGFGRVPAIVVGSSMVECLDLLTDGRVQVLGKNGMSARDTLEIVRWAGRLPERIAVELNGLTALAKDRFLDQLLSLWLAPARKHVLALRTECQPASIVKSLARAAVGRNAAKTGPSPTPPVLAQVRVHQLRDQSCQPPDMDQLRANLLAVRDAVAELERRGIRVTYFEFPGLDPLAKTVFHQARRAVNPEILGAAAAAAAVLLDDDEFETTDGIRLVPKDQQRVAFRLLEVLEASSQGADPTASP